jgi:hypothetical protein
VIGPGRYYFPNPTLSLARPHVAYYAYPGVTIVIGDGTGSTGNPFGYAAAATNWFTGHADFILSNQTQLVSMTQAGAYLYLECNSIWRKGTNMGTGIFERDAGKLVALWHDFCRTDPYDIYVDLFGDAVDADSYVHLEGPNWYWGDSCVEVGNFSVPGRAKFIGDYGEQIPFGHVPPSGGAGSSFVGNNCVVRFDTLSTGTNGSWGGIGTDSPTTTVFDVRQMKAASASRFGLFGVGDGMNARWVNTTFTGGAGVDPLHFISGNTPILENCIVRTGASATNSLRASAAVGVTVVGTLTLDKPVHDFVAVNGLVGGVHTNSYTTTNVWWNVGGHTSQVLDATNAMLLAITNAATLESGKASKLLIVNNKDTNMNVAVTAAGRRITGDGLQLNAGVVSFTVTNGRVAVVSYEKIGTNNVLSVAQQQN